MRIWVVLGGLLLAGCVSAQETYTPDGKKGHVINCTPGWAGGIVGRVARANTSWATCYQKAGEICAPQGLMSCSRLASRAPMDLSHDARAFTSPRLALARDPAGSDRHSRRQHAGCRPN